MAIAQPYLGKISTVETDWRPVVSLGFGEYLGSELAEFEPADQLEKVLR
jgi:hypothetical protein